jgi:rubrerythrin
VEARTTPNADQHTASTAEIIEGLNDLLKLDHDAIGAYEIAIERLEDRTHADQIAGFKRDHERHIRDLNELIAELGGTPTNEPHATGPLKEALQRLGAVGGDRGILIAWRTNELQARTKYDSYASTANRWPANAKRVVDRNALDEERHLEWATQVLNRLGVPTAEGLEDKVTTRLREAGAQVENLGHKVSDAASAAGQRVADAASTAGQRVADAASTAGHQVADAAGTAAATARNRIADGLDVAADGLEGVVDERLPAGHRAGDVGHRVASGMHGSAGYLREADLDRVRTDLERSAQQRPLRTLGILFATGFVIGRLLR